jgi:hypothetical protein
MPSVWRFGRSMNWSWCFRQLVEQIVVEFEAQARFVLSIACSLSLQ